MKRIHGLISLATLSVIAGLTITLLVNTGLRQTIVEPLADTLLVIRYAISQLPEYLVWVVLLLLSASLIARAWRQPHKSVERIPHRRRLLRRRRPRVSPSIDLAVAVARAPKSRVMRSRVRRDLLELAVRLVARNESIPLADARRRIRDEEDWTDDRLVRAFLGDRGRYTGTRRDIARDIEYTVRFLESYDQEV
jgi:hypothetical protein